MGRRDNLNALSGHTRPTWRLELVDYSPQELDRYSDRHRQFGMAGLVSVVGVPFIVAVTHGLASAFIVTIVFGLPVVVLAHLVEKRLPLANRSVFG